MVLDKVIHKTVFEFTLIGYWQSPIMNIAEFKCKLKLKATFLCAVRLLQFIPGLMMESASFCKYGEKASNTQGYLHSC